MTIQQVLSDLQTIEDGTLIDDVTVETWATYFSPEVVKFITTEGGAVYCQWLDFNHLARGIIRNFFSYEEVQEFYLAEVAVQQDFFGMVEEIVDNR